MEPLHARANWENLGDKWFRKTQQYTQIFDQDLDLNNYILVGAPYAGAIALWRDETKLQLQQPGRSSKPAVDLFSLAGNELRSIPWDQGAIRGLGWSDQERLLIVSAAGDVRVYDLQGDFSHFTLGHGADKHGVLSCRFYASGMVALLGNNSFVAVASLEEPRPKLLAKPPEGEVHSWDIIAPEQTLSRSVEVLLSIGTTIYVLDATECSDRFLSVGPFSHVSVSPDGQFVNLYGVDGKAHVISSDFQETLFEHDSDSQTPPKYVSWCASDALIAWEDEVHVIGPGKQCLSFIFDSTRVHVISEYDGTQLITNDYCEFLEKVPRDTMEVFGNAAESSPSSILLDAIGQLEKGSPKADEYIQLIRSNLTEAVETCIISAGYEWDVKWQKRLLSAASFGKSVLDTFNSDEFVDMCETLRVLNAVREHSIGIPLTYEKYHRLTPEGLIQRLLNRQAYLLALKIAEYLRLPSDRIHVHWASTKIRASTEDDEAICQSVVERLSGKPGISFEEIARVAYHEGRGRLATELLNHEPRGGRQVPFLLDMEEDEAALDKALDSGDTDLMLYVLSKLRKKLPLAAFFRAINPRPVAMALVEASAVMSLDNTLLKDLYYQDDRRLDGANVFIRESLQQPSARTAADKLALAAKLLSDTKEANLELHALKETTTLLRMQESFERDLTDAFTGLSVHGTLFKLIRMGCSSQAKKIQNEFRVPDKVAWWIRLRALVAKRDWSEIEEISKLKKSPIGWEPFFNLVLQTGNSRLAAVFVPKCTGLATGETVRMYEKCGQRVKAAEEAVRLKDAEAWQRLLEAAGRNTPEGMEIERLGRTALKK